MTPVARQQYKTPKIGSNHSYLVSVTEIIPHETTIVPASQSQADLMTDAIMPVYR